MFGAGVKHNSDLTWFVGVIHSECGEVPALLSVSQRRSELCMILIEDTLHEGDKMLLHLRLSSKRTTKRVETIQSLLSIVRQKWS